MDLEQTLKKAAGSLRSGRLSNEAQVKHYVIVPVLLALDWDVIDPESFIPEYSVDIGRMIGRVDYALLNRRRPGKPLVFIEAKRIDTANLVKGEEQLFRYASNKGVPFLVLTDGNRWDFYLSMAEGVPSERRFYRMELKLENKIPEYVDSLVKYLHKDRVVSGQAKLDAEDRHARNREREMARDAIPGAWRLLLKEPKGTLHNLLAERVESACGTEPEPDDVDEFLKGLSPIIPTPRRELGGASPVRRPQESKRQNLNRKTRSGGQLKEDHSTFDSSVNLVGFVLRGERVETGKAIGTLIALVERLAREDPAFMERFASKTRSPSRNLVARKRTDLYLKSPHLINNSKKLENGWWLGKHMSTERVRKYIKTACEVAGVRFGSELRLIER